MRTRGGAAHLIASVALLGIALAAMVGGPILGGYGVDGDVALGVAAFGLAGVPCSIGLSRRGLRMLQREAEEAMRDDPRPPVLYLRSFDDDDQTARLVTYKPGVAAFVPDPRAEESIAPMMNCLGPFVAIGRPGEPLPETGAYRMYVEDDVWQERVAELMDRARLVVMLGRATTARVHWEIERAVATLPPERLVFYFPTVGQGRERWFAAFRESAQQFLPEPLPESLGNASFLAFGDGWAPEPVEGVGATAIRARHESLLGLMRRLEPAFTEPPLRELVPKPRLYLAYAVLSVTGFLALSLIGFGVFKFNEIFSGV